MKRLRSKNEKSYFKKKELTKDERNFLQQYVENNIEIFEEIFMPIISSDSNKQCKILTITSLQTKIVKEIVEIIVKDKSQVVEKINALKIQENNFSNSTPLKRFRKRLNSFTKK